MVQNKTSPTNPCFLMGIPLPNLFPQKIQVLFHQETILNSSTSSRRQLQDNCFIVFLGSNKKSTKNKTTSEVFCLVLPQKRSTQCRGASKNFTAVSGLNICRKYSLRRRKMVGWSGWRAPPFSQHLGFFVGSEDSVCNSCMYIYKDLLRKIMVVSMETVHKTYCG